MDRMFPQDGEVVQEKRRMAHVRQISCKAFERTDGLWDVEGKLVDIKPCGAITPERGVIAPDEPFHEMELVLTVDQCLTIRDVRVDVIRSPYAACGLINDNYKKLIGLQIGSGFSFKVKNLFQGVQGCSHLTELLGPIATTAIQGVFGEPKRILSEGLSVDGAKIPSPIDGCHVLSSTGGIVEKYFPAFFRRGEKN